MTTYNATWETNIAEFLTYHCSSHNQASRPAVCNPCSINAFVNGLPEVEMVGNNCPECGGEGSGENLYVIEVDYANRGFRPDPEGQPTDQDFWMALAIEPLYD